MDNNKMDDASLWFESRHAAIQEYTEPEPVEISIVNTETAKIPETAERITASDVKTDLNMIKLNEPIAEIITGVMNSIVPILILLVIKYASQDDLELTQSEQQTIIQAWAVYLKDSNVEMSPGVVLIVTIASIYGGKITKILTDRKRQEELKQKDAKIEELNKIILEMRNSKPDAA
ncbi:MAG: hypothetical protein RBT49_11870 [Bacteroidales bacterium]|jgi:hypothetical protein|nr:hypothetical protein [Bacteroidales bacterium]